eukprot:scaffold4117_cov43-Phaeocystis_antarctica.AAC.2
MLLEHGGSLLGLLGLDNLAVDLHDRGVPLESGHDGGGLGAAARIPIRHGSLAEAARRVPLHRIGPRRGGGRPSHTPHAPQQLPVALGALPLCLGCCACTLGAPMRAGEHLPSLAHAEAGTAEDAVAYIRAVTPRLERAAVEPLE